VARTILNDELIALLVEALGQGLYVRHACDLCGISEASYWEWMRRAQDPNETNPIFGTFAEAAKKATAKDLTRNLELIRKAAVGGAVTERKTITKPGGAVEVVERVASPAWQAAGWLSERRHDEYKQVQRTEVTGAGGARLLFSGVEFRQVGEDEVLETVEVIDSGSPGAN